MVYMKVIGLLSSEEEANEKGYEKLSFLSVPYDIHELDTRDPRAARNKLRYKKMGNEEYGDVMQRARYKLPEPGGTQNEFTQ